VDFLVAAWRLRKRRRACLLRCGERIVPIKWRATILSGRPDRHVLLESVFPARRILVLDHVSFGVKDRQERKSAALVLGRIGFEHLSIRVGVHQHEDEALF